MAYYSEYPYFLKIQTEKIVTHELLEIEEVRKLGELEKEILVKQISKNISEEICQALRIKDMYLMPFGVIWDLAKEKARQIARHELNLE